MEDLTPGELIVSKNILADLAKMYDLLPKRTVMSDLHYRMHKAAQARRNFIGRKHLTPFYSRK